MTEGVPEAGYSTVPQQQHHHQPGTATTSAAHSRQTASCAMAFPCDGSSFSYHEARVNGPAAQAADQSMAESQADPSNYDMASTGSFCPRGQTQEDKRGRVTAWAADGRGRFLSGGSSTVGGFSSGAGQEQRHGGAKSMLKEPGGHAAEFRPDFNTGGHQAVRVYERYHSVHEQRNYDERTNQKISDIYRQGKSQGGVGPVEAAQFVGFFPKAGQGREEYNYRSRARSRDYCLEEVGQGRDVCEWSGSLRGAGAEFPNLRGEQMSDYLGKPGDGSNLLAAEREGNSYQYFHHAGLGEEGGAVVQRGCEAAKQREADHEATVCSGRKESTDGPHGKQDGLPAFDQEYKSLSKSAEDAKTTVDTNEGCSTVPSSGGGAQEDRGVGGYGDQDDMASYCGQEAGEWGPATGSESGQSGGHSAYTTCPPTPGKVRSRMTLFMYGITALCIRCIFSADI